MSHFPDEQWTDWVRGVAAPRLQAAMSEHLTSGCAECRQALATWERVAKVARRELAYEPPEDVVRNVLASFSETRFRPSARELPAHMAELVFDSFRSPLAAGVRGVERAARHLSYKAGSFYIDVRIEETGSSGLASVIGQLMHHPDASNAPLEGLSVVLTSGRATLAETKTNRFGEFTFEMDTLRENHLSIGVGDDFAVVVPLSGRRGQA